MQPWKSQDNLEMFRRLVEQCDTVQDSEKFVRDIIRRSASSAPIHIIKAMAQALADQHGRDMKNQLEEG